jgi:hypothetical protein
MAETNPSVGVDVSPEVATVDENQPLNSETDAAEVIVKKGILDDSEDDYLPSQDRGHVEEEPAKEEEETAEEEEPEGDESEPELGEEESEEYDVEVPTYTLNVKGKQVQVDLEELKNGYQKGADYTQKTQSLAEEKRSFDNERQAVVQERQQYNQALTQFQQLMNEQYQQYDNIDWAQLKEDDPIGYMTRKEEMRDIEGRHQKAAQEQQQVTHQQQQQYARQHQELVAKEMDLLGDKLPDWKNPDKRAKLSEELKLYAGNIGYSKEDLDAVTDHRSLLILNKARLYDKIQKSNPKKIKQVPKVVKGGSKNTQNRDSKSGKFQTKLNLAKKRGGRTEDIASAIFELM